MNSSPLGITVEVDDRRLMLHLEKLPMMLKSNLRVAITKLTDELLAQVRASEPRRTGRLQNLTRAYVDETEDSVRGRVRVLSGGSAHNVAAAALEYGAHATVSVRASRREGIAVRAYERHANIAARRFLRGPGEAIRAKALAELAKAISDAVKDEPA